MERFTEYAHQLGEPVTRKLLQTMLRYRHYSLEETRYKKDKGLVKVYMFDSWADPMAFQIGSYQEGEEPDWAAMYDAAMARHLENKEIGRDRWQDEDEDRYRPTSTWLPPNAR